MPDNDQPSRFDLQDKVDSHEFASVWFWAIKLGVSREQLQAAIKEVGPMVNDVKKHLEK